MLALVAILAAGGAAAYWLNEPAPRAAQILGVVRETEIRIQSETTGRLELLAVAKGQEVHKGDLLAVVSAPELAASVEEAKAAAGKARADRNNVFVGVRKEEVDISAQNVDIAEANFKLAQQEYRRWSTLAKENFATKQQLDESTAAVAEAQAKLDSLNATKSQDEAGPTAEQRAIAVSNVGLADASAAALEAKLAKTRLVAPVDGTVGVMALTPGEIISPGQSIMTVDARGDRWASFTMREDELRGLTIGSRVKLGTADGRSVAGRVTELRPLGEFATWRAARAVGDHDLNSFLVRVDPIEPAQGLEPGMTVWLERPA